jgi:hypothetical protein
MECHAKQEAPLKKYPRPCPLPFMEKEGKINPKPPKAINLKAKLVQAPHG